MGRLEGYWRHPCLLPSQPSAPKPCCSPSSRHPRPLCTPPQRTSHQCTPPHSTPLHCTPHHPNPTLPRTTATSLPRPHCNLTAQTTLPRPHCNLTAQHPIPLHLEGAHQRVVNAHHGTSVVELAAVVRRAKHGDQLPLREELIPVLDHLQQ